jgi:Helix-turn-helix domain
MTESRRTPFDDLDPLSVLTTAQVAARLGVDARSVRRAIDRGDLPASRACGLRVLTADAADWWRASAVRRAEPSSPAAAGIMPAPRRTSRRAQRDRLPLPPRGGSRRARSPQRFRADAIAERRHAAGRDRAAIVNAIACEAEVAIPVGPGVPRESSRDDSRVPTNRFTHRQRRVHLTATAC